MTILTLTTQSEEETQAIAKRLAKLLNPGDVIVLEGDLGAGKTTFTKGIATGLGVKRIVTSPTFTIIKEYEGRLPLYHMDAYRLEHSEEDIGFDEYFSGEGVSVVEWAQFIKGYLPEHVLEIEMKHLDDQVREMTFKATSAYFEDMLNKLKK